MDKELVTENVNKIRQTNTGDVLVQLQRGSNATQLKEAVATAIGSEATVLQLSQEVALDVRDMVMDTTEGEVQKALAEAAGVPVEVLKVKAMRPMYGGMQMAIVTMPRMNALHIIKSGKVRTGWVIARVREKISVPRCFRCSAFEHLSHNYDKGHATKPCFLCGAADHLRPAGANRCAPSARQWVSITDIDLGAQNALP